MKMGRRAARKQVFRWNNMNFAPTRDSAFET